MAFKMKKGNSPQKFLGALMGGIGGAAIGRGIRNRRARKRGNATAQATAGAQAARAGAGSQGRTPSGLGQTMAKGGYTGFGVAPGQVMGQGRRRSGMAQQRRGGGIGMFGGALGALGGGANFSAGSFGAGRFGGGGFGGGFPIGGFFKKEESAFQKPKKKKKKGFLSKWRNRRKFLKTEKENKNTKKESIYGGRGGYGR